MSITTRLNRLESAAGELPPHDAPCSVCGYPKTPDDLVSAMLATVDSGSKLSLDHCRQCDRQTIAGVPIPCPENGVIGYAKRLAANIRAEELINALKKAENDLNHKQESPNEPIV